MTLSREAFAALLARLNTTGREVIGAKVKGNVKAGQASSHIVD